MIISFLKKLYILRHVKISPGLSFQLIVTNQPLINTKKNSDMMTLAKIRDKKLLFFFRSLLQRFSMISNHFVLRVISKPGNGFIEVADGR